MHLSHWQQSCCTARMQVAVPGMASLLSNTGSVLQPESPCSSPTSTDPADLEAWNCKDHMIHIRFLLQLVNCVTLLAHYHIGGFLRQTSLVLVPPLLRTQWHPGGHCKCWLSARVPAVLQHPCCLWVWGLHPRPPPGEWRCTREEGHRPMPHRRS